MVGACAGIPVVAPACPTVVRPVRIGSSPVMKFAGSATRFRIVVGEAHTLVGHPVQIGRPAGHDALIVDTNIRTTDVIAHDDDDIWPLPRRSGLCLRFLNARGRTYGRCSRKCRPGEENVAPIYFWTTTFFGRLFLDALIIGIVSHLSLRGLRFAY